jgi:peptidoglycan/LPS O-acetylase OafA/YrhL
VPETHLPGSAVAFLGHMLVIWLLQAAAFSWIGNLTPPCLLVLLLGLGAPLTLLLSIALHRWIEMPGIGLGRRLNLR